MAKLVTMVSVCVLAAAFGCGGDSKKETTTTTTTTETTEDTTENKEPDVEISEDSLTEIDAMLKRKRDSVSRCFSEALKAKEVTKKDRGTVLVHFTIGTEGKATSSRIGEHKIDSKVLHSCILGKVNRWTFPKLPKELKYSYSFGFAYF